MSLALSGVRKESLSGLDSARPAALGSPAAQQDWARGAALMRGGEPRAALRLFERACRVSPRVSLYWLNQAMALRRLQQPGAALKCARRAFELDPRCHLSCHLAVELLRGGHRHAEALGLLMALLPAPQADTGAQTRTDVQHGLLHGSLLAALGRHQDAAGVFLQVLARAPADADAYMQLGFSLAALRQFAEAAECFRTVTLINPAQLGAAVYAAHYAAWACDWRQGQQDHQRLLGALALQEGRLGLAPPFSPFCLLAMSDDAGLQRRTARLEARRLAHEMLTSTAWRPGATAPGQALDEATRLACRARLYPEAASSLAAGRCRVGLVSADFRTHATGLLLVQTLENLDRERFDLTLYSHGADDGTPLCARLQKAADHFVDCSTLSLVDQAKLVHADGITLLIDMSGYTTGSRLALFALRPAPVQAVWLAYPGTLGAEFVDYLIGDPVLTPLAHADDFDEKIVQLPLCYEPTDEHREHPDTTANRSDMGLPEDGFVYACFNQSYKITDEVFSRWCRILHRVDGSVLWLLVPQPSIQVALLARAAERGIAADRLVFAPFVPTTEHLARLPLADVFLDTFPYGAHTTCSDALWMGLPVLTQVGRCFASRVAASLLGAVGLPDLVVQNAQDYEEIAVRLAEDGEALCDIRDHLWDNRRDLPLFDNPRFAAELGDVFDRMAQRWMAGLAPEALPAA